jgi:uncharacterized protein involved in exopolysaccharide biosynthesis
MMLATDGEEFDLAAAPGRPYSPQPAAWVLFGLLGGLVLSVSVVLYGPERRWDFRGWGTHANRI